MANGGYRRQVAAGRVPPTLPPTVEEAYRKKCIELKRRMSEVEQNNDSVRLRKTRLLRGIRKMRLERSLLLNELKKRMRKSDSNGGYWDEDSEGSSENPPTPHDKPLRSKRSHRRPAPTPPPLAHQLSTSNGGQHQHPNMYYRNHYATPREFPFDTIPEPNPRSHVPAAPTYQSEFPINTLYPTRRSQIPYGSNTYEYFMRGNYLGHFRGPLAALPQDEQLALTDNLAMGTTAWFQMSDRDRDYWAERFHNDLQRWRAQMDSLARETGELPRGEFKPHGYGWEEDKKDSAIAAEQCCEQRGLDFVFGMDGGVEVGETAAANGGFTAVNNNLKREVF